MLARTALLLLFIACVACQSGKIPCPEIKFAKIKESKVHKRSKFEPELSKVLASTKTANTHETTRQVNLNRLKATRVTGKEMLEHYGSVEGWDCPSPAGKKRYSKVVKENIRKNEKKMREHLKNRSASDSVAIIPMGVQ